MSSDFDIAIVGMACRFPGARNLDEFWRNLTEGVESITRFSDEDLAAAGVPPEVRARHDYVKASPVLDQPGHFDAAFFGFSPSEAAMLDPQHRLLLELGQAALDDAGCDPARSGGRAGVFVGSAMNTYYQQSGLGDTFAENYIPTLIANDKDFLATRLSYKLGLRGPSLTVQTACSTSLVALHLARQSLLSEETDLAIAGAVSIRVPHRAGYFYDGSGVVSPDGHVRAFDANANGTVFGSGGGVVVLKRLADAQAQGDRIYAVIKGCAVNNDGAEKAGYTAPSVDGQADAVIEALANAGVDAVDVSYLEAHGSGTPVGDRIELLALTKAFRSFTDRSGYCAIGSVKTNVGHLDAAAGMAGVIKTALALQHRKIPATLNFERPNEEIDFPNTPFFVNAATRDWPGGGPRRAGVMATGMGGTNACVVLEEAPGLAEPLDSAAKPPHLLVLSAKTATALDAMAADLADFLAARSARAGEEQVLARTAHTLQAGRRHFAHRRFVVGREVDDAVAALRAEAPAKGTSGAIRSEGAPPVVFLLPGVGDHYVNMGRGLYERFDAFRQEVDRCAETLAPLLGLDVRDVLFSAEETSGTAPATKGIDLKRMLGRGGEDTRSPAAKRLDETIHNQPALFTLEYALAKLWMSWGVVPERIVGHSLGEYVAACLAGVVSLEDALRLVAMRARLVSELPRGAMLAVMMPEEQLRPLLSDGLSISLINSPNLCVVAGPSEAIETLARTLKEKGAVTRPVRNAHAFHSRMLDPIADAFAAEARQIRFSAPRIPFISNVTGTWITDEQAADPRYWAEHARSTARFSDALAQLWRLPECTLLEIGPGRTLGVLAFQHPARPANRPSLILSSLRHDYENQPDAEFLLQNVGRLWLTGTPLEWDGFEPESARRKISLPAYPFERHHYWLERAATAHAEAGREKGDIADWFYVPSWQQSRAPLARTPDTRKSAWLIIADDQELASLAKAELDSRRADVSVALFGDRAERKNEKTWSVRAAELDDYIALIGALKARAARGLNILHLGALSSRHGEAGFHSLVALVQALGEHGIASPVRLGIVTASVHDVMGEEALNPAGATASGLAGVIAKEYPNVTSFSVDVPSAADLGRWAAPLLDEFEQPEKGAMVAYRGRRRWTRTFVAQKLPAAISPTEGLRSRGVYLITGGTGGLGLAIARYLAESCQARLVLTKRTPFPAKQEWAARLAGNDLSERDRRILVALREIETLGGEVDVQVCDVTDRDAMQRVVSGAIEKHGALHGVLHTAGILREGVLQLKTRTVADAVLTPKVRGAEVLFDVVRELDLDVLVLFSSVSSVVTYHGQGDYCAANAFLDAFAHYASAQASFPTISIDWPVWRDVGILAESKTPATLEARKEQVRRRAISTKDGIEIFKRAMAARLPQLVVSARDLNYVMAEAAEPIAEPKETSTVSKPPFAVTRRPVMDEPRDDVERAVAEIWSGVLGVAPIGINESFLDLGGHSLMAMRIVTQIRNAYQIDFTLRKFFARPTIAGTALAIQEDIVAEIESMPEETADSLAT